MTNTRLGLASRRSAYVADAAASGSTAAARTSHPAARRPRPTTGRGSCRPRWRVASTDETKGGITTRVRTQVHTGAQRHTTHSTLSKRYTNTKHLARQDSSVDRNTKNISSQIPIDHTSTKIKCGYTTHRVTKRARGDPLHTRELIPTWRTPSSVPSSFRRLAFAPSGRELDRTWCRFASAPAHERKHKQTTRHASSDTIRSDSNSIHQKNMAGNRYCPVFARPAHHIN